MTGKHLVLRNFSVLPLLVSSSHCEPKLTLPIAKMHYSWAEQGISIPPVQIHDTDTEGRGRALSHYLKDNHAKYSLLYHGKLFHNHVSHVCSHSLPLVSLSP